MYHPIVGWVYMNGWVIVVEWFLKVFVEIVVFEKKKEDDIQSHVVLMNISGVASLCSIRVTGDVALGIISEDDMYVGIR